MKSFFLVISLTTLAGCAGMNWGGGGSAGGMGQEGAGTTSDEMRGFSPGYEGPPRINPTGALPGA